MAATGLDRVRNASYSLRELVDFINSVTDSFINMSAAFEQQSQVAGEINRQVASISELADHSSNRSEAARTSSEDLRQRSRGLNDLVQRFQSNQ